MSTPTSITKQRQQTAYQALAETFGYTSPMQGPRILKVVVSSGVGKKRDKKQLELIENRLAKSHSAARGCTTS
jgi:ribosomal protein L5